ncbi:MAG: vitamin K epoxide reductase family protein [Phycisphaerae bacterium]
MLSAAALAGCFTSGVLVRMSLPSSTPATLFGAALCAPGDHVNCDYVLASRWAKIGPIPTAVFGLVYFSILTAWYLIVGLPNSRGRHWHLFPLILTTLGVCSSLWFVYVMSQLPVWCSWCLAGHVFNGLLFILTILARPRRVTSASREAVPYPSHTRAGIVLGGCVAGVLIVFLAILALIHQSVGRRFQLRALAATNNAEYIAWRHSRAPLQAIPIRADDVIIGRSDAPFTLVVFTDFECGKCRYLHREIVRLISQFPEKLRCVSKHYPVSKQCNPYVGAGLHYFACDAAFAAEAARETGTADQTRRYHRLLYENSVRFDQSPYDRLAEQVGMDRAGFLASYSGAAIRRRVAEDIELAHRLGVEGTPTLFLNNRRLEAWRIVTQDASPKMDVERTLGLWERLLGGKAVMHRQGANSTGSG